MSVRGQRQSARKQVLTTAIVSEAKPQPAPYVIWDTRLTGFGLRVSPGGTKSFLVQYRAGEGRRTDANRKVTLGRFPMLSPASARKQALAVLGAARVGADPSRERARERGLPKLGEAIEDWMQARTGLRESSLARYRSGIAVLLEGWSNKRLDELTREDVAQRFAKVTQRHGWTQANKGMKVLGAVYRRCVADHPTLRDPVALWAAAGGRLHPSKRRQIEAPADVLPAWVHGIEHAGRRSAVRDLFWAGLYTGMRLNEVRSLRWERVDFPGRSVRVDQTKSGESLVLPLTRQLQEVLERRWAARAIRREDAAPSWVFTSARSRNGQVGAVDALYRSIERYGGKPFWFHAMRNCFITVASRDLLLPEALVKRLVNHRRAVGDVTQGYAADWTLEQLRGPAQRIADRIDELIAAGSTTQEGNASAGPELPDAFGLASFALSDCLKDIGSGVAKRASTGVIT